VKKVSDEGVHGLLQGIINLEGLRTASRNIRHNLKSSVTQTGCLTDVSV
jgi:hypothetical protein